MTQSLAQLQAELHKRAEGLLDAKTDVGLGRGYGIAQCADALQPHVEREAKYEAVVAAALKWRDATNDADDLVAANELLDTLAALSSEEK